MREISFKNRDILIQLGISIAAMRKINGMSQEQLAEKADISRTHLSMIEAPFISKNFTLDTFLKIADALKTDPITLLQSTKWLNNYPQ